MEIKINIYTSFYKKMLHRHKQENDIYIQVSRSLFMPVKGVDGVSMSEMIDINMGDCLGMFHNTLQEYEDFIRSDDMKENLDEIVKILSKETLGIDEAELKKQFENCTEEELQELKEMGMTKDEVNFNFYLLCFEDLDTCYTKKDEEKNADCKAGTKKQCHRTIIAKVLNDMYNLNIKEL